MGATYNYRKFNHRLNRKEIIWNSIVVWAIFFTAWDISFDYAFELPLRGWQLWSETIISSIFLFDFIYHICKKNFYNNRNQEVTAKTFFLKYLNLALDILASIPFDLIFYYSGISGGQGSVYKLFRLIRIIRLAKTWSFFSKLTIIPSILKTQLAIAVCFLSVHYITCGWIIIYPVPIIKAVSNFDYYISSMYWAVTTLTTVGYGDIVPMTNAGKMYNIIIMFLGVGMYGLVIARLSKFFSESVRHKDEYRMKINDILSFMRHYKIPERIQQSVFDYYRHLMDNHFSSNDNQVISELPHVLKSELQIYMNMRLIKNTFIFKSCSHSCLKIIASALKQKSYAPGEYIINVGDIGYDIFIISHGIVSITAEDGSPLAILQEGQFFGEVSLLQETKRTANAIAESYCDIYTLDKDSFIAITSSYPELKEDIKKFIDIYSTELKNVG